MQVKGLVFRTPRFSDLDSRIRRAGWPREGTQAKGPVGRTHIPEAVAVPHYSDQFYGDRNAGVQDSWGNNWWIATHIEDVDEAEVQRRMAGRG